MASSLGMATGCASKFTSNLVACDVGTFSDRLPVKCSHRPEYLLFFYYPQETSEIMGPTEILPQSQYLSNDSDPEHSHPLVVQKRLS